MADADRRSIPDIPDEAYDPTRNVGRLLHDAAAKMARAVDRRAQQAGVTGAQWVVLIRIGGGIGNTAAELCRTLGYTSGAMTRMLDRLEKLGLVRRAPSIGDGRVTAVSLTAAGQALYPRLTPIAIDVIDDHLQGFAREEVEKLIGFLERIIASDRSRHDEITDSGPDAEAGTLAPPARGRGA